MLRCVLHVEVGVNGLDVGRRLVGHGFDGVEADVEHLLACFGVGLRRLYKPLIEHVVVQLGRRAGVRHHQQVAHERVIVAPLENVPGAPDA